MADKNGGKTPKHEGFKVGKGRERHGDGPDRDDETPPKGGALPKGVEGKPLGRGPGRTGKGEGGKTSK